MAIFLHIRLLVALVTEVEVLVIVGGLSPTRNVERVVVKLFFNFLYGPQSHQTAMMSCTKMPIVIAVRDDDA